MTTPKPVFIFSLPRSGSTLLQRMLSVHPEISTASETWVLLPFTFAIRNEGTYAQYSHLSSAKAIADVIAQLPNGKSDYYQGLRLFAQEIYKNLASGDSRYFLDKTPRYYMIINEIAEIFPDAKYIFLFRNPLAVLSSIIESFYQGRLGDWRHKIDLFQGPKNLTDGLKKLKDQSIAIQYEALLTDAPKQISSICKYLEIPYDENLLLDFNKVQFKGRMGDQIGTSKYSTIETKTIEKWHNVLNTKLRKKYAEYYLKKLGRKTVSDLGYDIKDLLSQIDQIEGSMDKFFMDIYKLMICELSIRFEFPLLKKNLKNRIAGNSKPYVHY